MAMFMAAPVLHWKKHTSKMKRAEKVTPRQKPTHEMQSHKPEIVTCLSDEQKERDIATEVPIRMNVSLPPCWVVLHRLTEEQINQPYPDSLEQANFEDLSTDSQDSFYTAFERDCRRRRLRDFSKIEDDFEIYKQNREKYLNRRNRLFDPFYESSEMSQDEFKNSGKGKKRSKKVKKYEQDSEWSPYSEKSVPHGKRLRKRVRRPVIDSDTSSTDEEDLLYSYYNMNDFNGEPSSSDTAFQNVVPSETTNNDPTASSKSDSKGTDEKALSDSNLSGKSSKSSQSGDPDSVLDSNHNSDVLSGIIKDMDACKRGNTSKLKISSSGKKTPIQTNVKPKLQRGRKRLKLSNLFDSDVNLAVNNIILEMVNTVCMQHKQSDIEKKKFFKKCKWCHTQFPTSNADEIMCAICYDQGKGKYVASTSNKISNQPVKEKPEKMARIKKQSAGNKVGKKVNSTMSRVLKKLPKNEMQRLMYEKSGNLPNEKRYNHCKSLFLKDEFVNESSKTPLDANNVQSNNSSQTLSEDKEAKPIRETKKVIKKSVSAKKLTTVVKSTTPKYKSQSIPKEAVDCESTSKNKIPSKKFDERLFLINFPDPNSELNVESPDNRLSTVHKDELGKSSRYNGSCATRTLEKVIPSTETKTSNQTSKEDQYQTYLLPPVPTVLIANYSSNSDNNGNYRLSSIFYQNEFTQQHSIKKSINLGAMSSSVTVTPTLPSSCSSNQITSPPASNVLNNNALTTISLDKGMDQIQAFFENDSLAFNSLSTPSLTRMPLMPIVSSVVSLRDRSIGSVSGENDFTDNNFVNSEQLQIRITSVASQITCGSSLAEEGNSIETDMLHHVAASTKSQNCVNSDDAALHTLRDENPVVPNMSVSTNSDKYRGVENIVKLANGQTEESIHDTSEKQPNKPKDAINSAIDLLGAISILAVIDLDKSPRAGLNIRIQMAKSQLAKLNSEKNAGTEHSARIASCQYNLELLDTANKFLNLYGSFAKVSDFLLRKHRMIQIKKEMLDEEEEEEGNQSSCRFSQRSQSTTSLSNQDLSTPTLSSPSPLAAKMENLNSCRVIDQASINHIEKLQSQIAAMNNTQLTLNNADFSQYDLPNTGTVHHFAAEQFALAPAIGAPTPVTPRNDYIGGESRETPSRGSGPRTPARPESATSQPDEQAITAQIKKELMEVSTSLSSQCHFSQNTTLTPISSQIQTVQDMSSLNVGHSIANTLVQHIVGNDSANRMYQTRAPPSYNQNYSNVLLNIAPNSQVSPNVGVDQNGQFLIGQQLYIPSGTGLPQKQAVPSISNQYVLPPPFSNSNTVGGTVLVNSSQVRSQNVNALLTNVSNQQFYTSSQVPQVYYPPQPQLTSMPSTIPTSTLTVAQNQAFCSSAQRKLVLRKVHSIRCINDRIRNFYFFE